MADQVEEMVEMAVPRKASPQAPLPAIDPLTKSQWRTLMAFADTVIPSVVQEKRGKTAFKEAALPSGQYAAALSSIEHHVLRDEHKSIAQAYLAERPSQLPEFRANVHRFIGLYTPKALAQLLAMGLDLLDYRVTSLFMTGYPSSFADQPVHIREKIILSWTGAKIPIYRQLFKQLTLLVKQNWVKSSPTLYTLLHFPYVPVHMKPGKTFEFEFIQVPPGSSAEIIETDVIIVGSGCGSAVSAKNIAEAGHRVLVVDKAYHWPAEHLPMKEADGWNHMFMGGGAMFSDDATTCVIAGGVWGGGGTINWSACLQTQGFVRREWASDNLPFFTSSEFQDSLDRVCDRMGASAANLKHNPGNDVLLEGARRLGWAAKAVPQNTGGAQHYCGYCTMGCGSCEKQGPVVSYLPDAAKAGAHFMEGFDVRRVLFAQKNGKKVATGVEGIWTSRDEHGGVAGTPLVQRRVIIKAKRVIVSAGTMQSPMVLLRSGLKNRWIGRNLRLHPVSFIGATYDEEVRPWEGGILTAVVNEYENQDQQGHGTKLEAVTMLPSGWLSFLSWTGGVDYKLLAPRMKNMVGHFAIQRDTGSGQVYPDPHDGRPRIVYAPTKKDRVHLMEGMLALAKINYVMGAREIFTTVPGTSIFTRPANQDTVSAEGDPAFQEWLGEVRKRGLPDPDTIFVSAHQMGTCRMASSAKKGVVDAKGKVFGVDEGLYVIDASVFPSASGVNPMVTNMALADWLSRNVARDLKMGTSLRASL
ncbi:hypothetical protein EG328_008933 [Venturia inaequalis]|uniref:Long-chain-alcohol oxidase n=1 Tax=Venturia inaequalis TaxID=5025 RepID=A0A8H3YQF0_VENIN|nr:hypothetical protein EG328_008933 [Venturia inaequalis]